MTGPRVGSRDGSGGSGSAVVLVDVINDLEFDGGRRLLESALEAADTLTGLLDRARGASIPVIYANDNFGRWREEFRELLRHCLEDGVRGEPLARRLRPGDSDYFLLKPRHSAFYQTALDHLLGHLGVDRLILAGFATDNCVQATAADAHMRGYELVVPLDCSAAETDERHRRALQWIERVAHGEIGVSAELELGDVPSTTRS